MGASRQGCLLPLLRLPGLHTPHTVTTTARLLTPSPPPPHQTHAYSYLHPPTPLTPPRPYPLHSSTSQRTKCLSRSAPSVLLMTHRTTRPPLSLQLNMPEDEVAETIRSFRKNHLSELQALAQIRCGPQMCGTFAV